MKSEFVNYLQQDSILMLDGKTKKEVLEEIISYATTRCTLDDIQLRDLRGRLGPETVDIDIIVSQTVHFDKRNSHINV